MRDVMAPGYPGRGYDPTPGFTDMQWYMYHQRNVAHFAAFSAEVYDEARIVALARVLLEAAPHFGLGWRGAGTLPDDATLARLGRIETVDSFEGLPDRWLDDALGVFGDPDLPLFRIRIAQRRGGADAAGRRSLLVVQVAHALTEGSDSALLARSHGAVHEPTRQGQRPPTMVAAAGRVTGWLAAIGHLIGSRLVTPHPGRIRAVTRAWPREPFTRWARRLGVSQRALYLGLGAYTVNRAGTGTGGRRISCTYSTLDPGEGIRRDPFMRMRMRFAAFDNRPDFPAFVQGIEGRLAHERRESGFSSEVSAAAIAAHRRLAGALPFLYGPCVFDFMPFDLVFGLLPPHRLAGPLSEGLLEPVYAGALLPGVNACVVVPGRTMVSFGFYVEERLVDEVARLDALVGPELAAAVVTPARNGTA